MTWIIVLPLITRTILIGRNGRDTGSTAPKLRRFAEVFVLGGLCRVIFHTRLHAYAGDGCGGRRC